MGYNTRADLENALSAQTVRALFADDNDTVVNEEAIASVLARADAIVDSFLARSYSGPLPIAQAPIPALVKAAAIDYAVSFSFERHPEYVRTFGEGSRSNHWARANITMEHVAAAIQRLPDYAAQPTPRTAGGLVYDFGPRMTVDNGDSTTNNGGF